MNTFTLYVVTGAFCFIAGQFGVVAFYDENFGIINQPFTAYSGLVIAGLLLGIIPGLLFRR